MVERPLGVFPVEHIDPDTVDRGGSRYRVNGCFLNGQRNHLMISWWQCMSRKKIPGRERSDESGFGSLRAAVDYFSLPARTRTNNSGDCHQPPRKRSRFPIREKLSKAANLPSQSSSVDR